MIKRGRRLRINKEMRDLVRENILTANDFIFPIFVVEGNNIKKEISSLPGNYHVSLDRLNEIDDEVVALNIKGVIIFGLPEHKDACGSEAYSDNGIVQKAIRKLREDYENLLVITDVCMCEYTSHGHCGIIEGKDVDNDKTLSFLDKIAVSHAKAGAHMVAPSDMMDGRILSMRNALDEAGFDIVKEVRNKVDVPVCVYNVSGEFAMVKAAAKLGLINEKQVALEMLLSMKRAGADMIITYYAIEAAKWLQE